MAGKHPVIDRSKRLRTDTYKASFSQKVCLFMTCHLEQGQCDLLHPTSLVPLEVTAHFLHTPSSREKPALPLFTCALMLEDHDGRRDSGVHSY